MNKYRNKPTVVDGIRFHSKRESERYLQLKLLEKAGEIDMLELQPKFTFELNGEPIRYPNDSRGRKGRPVTYKADFGYVIVRTAEKIIEDVKGGKATQTEAFRLKAALMLSFHQIKILTT